MRRKIRIAAIMLVLLFIAFLLFYVTKNPLNTAIHVTETDSPLLRFMSGYFFSPNGGIYTNLRDDFPNYEHVANNHKMLSESTGLFMLYAIKADKQAWFENQYDFLTRQLMDKDHHIRWVIDPVHPNQHVNTNATIDDLRIIRALLAAHDRWSKPKYYNTAMEIANNLYNFTVSNDSLTNFYSWSDMNHDNKITASYLDLYTLRKLTELDGKWKPIYAEASQLLLQAQMQNGLFLKTYRLDRLQWEAIDEFNAVDSLLCALHLAEIGQNVQPTINFLQNQWKRHQRLYTAYNLEALPLGDVESPAVYAIAYRLTKLISPDDPMLEQIMERMQMMAVTDEKSDYYGGYVDTAKLEAYSFDQLQALLAEAEGAAQN